MATGKLHASTFTYPPSQEAKVLHESRNTPHSSKVSLYGICAPPQPVLHTAAPWLQEFLTWKKPGNLTRRQSAELDVDLNERFYHDYLHERSGGCGVGVAGAHACSVLYCAVLPPEQMETSVRM